MRQLQVPLLLAFMLLSGCFDSAPPKPVEYMDDRTAITVGALKEPIELLQDVMHSNIPFVGKRASYAYLGPIEWDRSGSFTYGLWLHIAPGNTAPIADIRSSGALTLMLDDVQKVLVPMDAPQLGRGAYEPIASWGQTAYFELSVELLKQMAASQKFQLDVRGADGSVVTFLPTHATQAVLNEYLSARGITGG